MEHDGIPCASEIMIRHREKLLLYGGYLRTNLTGGSFPKSILKHQQVEPEFLQAPAFAIRARFAEERVAPWIQRSWRREVGLLFWFQEIFESLRTCSNNDVVTDDRWFLTTKIGGLTPLFNPRIFLRRRRWCKFLLNQNIKKILYIEGIYWRYWRYVRICFVNVLEFFRCLIITSELSTQNWAGWSCPSPAVAPYQCGVMRPRNSRPRWWCLNKHYKGSSDHMGLLY